MKHDRKAPTIPKKFDDFACRAVDCPTVKLTPKIREWRRGGGTTITNICFRPQYTVDLVETTNCIFYAMPSIILLKGLEVLRSSDQHVPADRLISSVKHRWSSLLFDDGRASSFAWKEQVCETRSLAFQSEPRLVA